MEVNELLHLLEERLVQHDNNRKEVQDKLEELRTGMSRDADLLEERISEELQCSFNEREESILNLIEKLNIAEEDDKELVVEQAQEELSTEFKYEIQHLEKEVNFVDSYKLKIIPVKINVNVNGNDTEDVIDQLTEHLNKIHEINISLQNDLTEICTKRRNDAEELKKRINEKLEFYFTQEDARIQEVAKMIKDKSGDENTEELKTKAKLTLLVNQKYSLSNGVDLGITKELSLKYINFEERKPLNIITSFTDKGEFSLSFTFFDDNEIDLLKTATYLFFIMRIKIWDKNVQTEEENTKIITKDYILGDKQLCFIESFKPNTTYCMTMRIEQQGLYTQWSDGIEFTTPEFKDLCVWKECPDGVNENMKYFVDENNTRIAISFSNKNRQSTVIGNTPLLLNKVTSWNIKLLKSEKNDGKDIYIGVSPFDIDQNENNNYNKYGWYFGCYGSTLWSGPPHNYHWKAYGPRKEGGYIQIGDSVGVVMDTTKGELSFALNEVNFGVAYEGIPLDKPLIPCVILGIESDSVEFDTFSEVKENVVDSSIPVPSNITTKSDSWDSITLSWNNVEGAEFYQIEVDGNKTWDVSTTKKFTKWRLLPETEHSFRVRTMKMNSVSEWSDNVKVKTLKAPDFSESDMAWKEFLDDDDKYKKYSVDKKNPRIATSIGDYGCTMIGNAPIPLNKVTSWGIEILYSWSNGRGIYIGVLPFDINQNNYEKCGWYFICGYSSLYSGPPHNYNYKAYGPRKRGGQYVHNGDSVGVVMDMTKGELSFVLNGVNCGVAYEGIPLDKPLMPCVLGWKGDSVELIPSSVKDNVSSSIPIPSNIVSNIISWNSITLTWDNIKGASFYQIEVDNNKCWDASTVNNFTIKDLLPETEHSFRVRTVKDNKASEWSDAMKINNFSKCVWKECPDYVELKKKYSVDENNPRIATCISDYYFTTIIGNTLVPPNKITSWSIKILKSDKHNTFCVYIGVAPFDINQNDAFNYYKCGWYFDCYFSILFSGPPHKYSGKEYGPRKGDGKYVHNGDSVGVVMDMTKGDLSFVLYGVNPGVAFKGIPLDKPLMPCVLLKHKSNSVELVI